MKRKLAVLLCLCMIIALSAIPVAEAAPASDTIQIKVCMIDPASQRPAVEMQKCIDEVNARTNGAVELQLYTDGQMLVNDEGVEAVMAGANVIVAVQSSYLSSYWPVMAVFGAPYVFSDAQNAVDFYATDYFKAIAEECEKGGVHIICADAMTGSRNLICNTNVESVADLQKLNVRIAGLDGLMKLFDAMGCSYQVFPVSECFNGLQTGAIDGLENSPTGMCAHKWYEAINPIYFIRTQHIQDGYFLIAGSEFWSSIPEEYRTILDEVLGGWGKATTQGTLDDEAECFKTMEAGGCTVVEPSEATIKEFRDYAVGVVSAMEQGEEVLAEVAKLAK